MRLGIVSNCWQVQLADGESLESLLARGLASGFEVFELRQTCLGTHESLPDHIPNAPSLASLPFRFPRARLNLAVAWPYFAQDSDPGGTLFAASLEAALALAGEHDAHLRLVDLKTTADELAARGIDAVADQLTRLVALALSRGVRISIENARQPWDIFLAIFRQARDQLASQADGLRLCYDPCNLLSAASDDLTHAALAARASRITLDLHASELAQVHLKQRYTLKPVPGMGAGELDWPAQFAALRDIGYAGPYLFEIPPEPGIWSSLKQSCQFVEQARASDSQGAQRNQA